MAAAAAERVQPHPPDPSAEWPRYLPQTDRTLEAAELLDRRIAVVPHHRVHFFERAILRAADEAEEHDVFVGESPFDVQGRDAVRMFVEVGPGELEVRPPQFWVIASDDRIGLAEEDGPTRTKRRGRAGGDECAQIQAAFRRHGRNLLAEVHQVRDGAAIGRNR